jgi:hypothetical protein
MVGNLRLANAFRRSKINRRRNPASAAQSLEPGKGSQPLFPARWLVGSLARWLVGSLARWLVGSLARWLVVVFV